jgi:hypothetical protein
MSSAPLRGMLFDWRGTLFHDESVADRIREVLHPFGRDPSAP